MGHNLEVGPVGASLPYTDRVGRREFLLQLSILPDLLQKAELKNVHTPRETKIGIIDQLSVATGGSGNPVLFIHGFGSSKYTWRHVCRGIQDIHSYYAIDLPGSGESPAPSNFQYTLEEFADVIADYIINNNLKNLMLVGASFGGGAVLLALLRHTAELLPRIQSLCLVDGIAYPQTFPFFVGVLRVPILGPLAAELISPRALAEAVLDYCYFDRNLVFPEQVEEYARIFSRKEVREALIKTARSINTEHLSRYVSQLKTIRVLTLLIWGREDRVVPLSIGQRLSQTLPASRLTIVDQCGHMPQEERPDRVIATLRAFSASQ